MSKNNKGKNTINAVWKIAEPIADSLNLNIWDIKFLKEGIYWYLRIFIDKPSGVTIEDCEAMSKAIDKPLDDFDFMNKSYCLEVCSPGVERELSKENHFLPYIGRKIKIKFIRPLKNGEKNIDGILHSFVDGVVRVETNEGNISVDKKDTVYIKLDDFKY